MTPFIVDTVFDGTTVLDLSAPSDIVQETQIRRFLEADFPAAGVLDLPTIPSLGTSPLWCPLMSLVPDNPAHVGSVLMVLQNGATETIIADTTVQQERWNILLPQFSQLQVTVDDGAGGFADGTLYFGFYGIDEKDWNRLQCCHFLAPGVIAA